MLQLRTGVKNRKPHIPIHHIVTVIGPDYANFAIFTYLNHANKV